MASSGSFSGSIRDGHYAVRVDWTQTKNVSENTSTITCRIYLVNDWSLSINSRNNNTMTIDGKAQNFTSPSIGSTGTHLLGTVSQKVMHGSDGGKAISMSVTEAGELLLTILAAFAQAESESASESSKMAYLHRIENGEVVAYLERSYGYEKDENGEYRAKEPEASVIREIYDLVIQGVNCTNIAKVLNARNIQTVQGAEWTASTVFRIVENEIYKGDVLMQKTFIDGKRHQVQNRGEKAMYYAKDNHPPIVSEKIWEKAQRKLEDMRAERAEHSVIQEFTEENYPYMNHIFCAKCGWPLKPRVYSHGHRLSWDCSGQKRGTKKFCTGIHILDNDLQKMKIEGNRYFSETVDKYGEVHLKHVGERTWKNKHKKKKFNHKDLYPELNEENYPYYRRLYCARCGSRLGRYISHGTVRWICSSYKRKGQAKCPGVRIPDEIIKGWNLPDGKIYIMGKEDKNGEKHYSYTSESAL